MWSMETPRCQLPPAGGEGEVTHHTPAYTPAGCFGTRVIPGRVGGGSLANSSDKAYR